MKPGRELDALVAEKVMGWQNVSALPGQLRGYPPESCHCVLKVVPFFSSEIESAWQVVEKTGLLSRDGHWLANLSPEAWGIGSGWSGWIRGSTAPHAICLAALKAVGALS